jgi:hypothetical protein
MGKKSNIQNIKIIKVPLGHKQTDLPKNFPKMPRMYLELLENKAKVKPELVNIEYIPNETNTQEKPREVKPKEEKPKEEKPKEEKPKEEKPKEEKLKEVNTISTKNLLNKIRDIPNDIQEPFTHDVNSESEDDDDDDEDDDDISFDEGSSNKSTKSNKTEDVETKLRRMLDPDNNVSESGKQSPDFSDFQSTVSNKYKHKNEELRKGDKQPPTLKELEQTGGYIPKKEPEDIGKPDMTEQEEEDMKRELLFKFELLKRKYPDSSVPDFSLHSSYQSMKKTYDMAIRRLSLDSSVDSYKTYLLLGFAACEYGLGVWGGFDVSGFTQHQMTKMSGYETLLIEMGERTYSPDGSSWPIEVRLVFMIIVNAVMFIVTKQIMKKAGGAIGNIFGMGGGGGGNGFPVSQPAQKRRMNGPDIDLDNMP